jgi:hypothetical protein
MQGLSDVLACVTRSLAVDALRLACAMRDVDPRRAKVLLGHDINRWIVAVDAQF